MISLCKIVIFASLVMFVTRVNAEVLPRTHLKVVGNLAGVTQYTQHEEPFWTHRIKQASGGAITAEITPFNRSGIDRQTMLSLLSLGVLTMGTSLLSGMSAEDPEVFLTDIAGLSFDLPTHRAMVDAYRPRLKSILAERHKVELLAMYVYPSQVLICRHPFASIAEIKGRRIRTSNTSQVDLVEGLGGVAVPLEFQEIGKNFKFGSIDCAITSRKSGNMIGLPESTIHVSTLPINWGTAAFIANKAFWDNLDPSIRAFLSRELAGLEKAIWMAQEIETQNETVCDSGRGVCAGSRPGRMTIVEATETDRALLGESLRKITLPRWIQRCGIGCKASWNATLGPPSSSYLGD